eukprot:CAMPEP_0177534172 /NCGR_PEP_ID=MMETSP0369-20130122/55771_1 /TAXON_ID=447022 ORGANISM="Scrippsiella hangoei-like, Strain SHHI-4" /NCGR_SAMPLE_ID=MMETSP0369 /ASSEMBLY_ACC=CAM_ASM_000364 /LENGTH=53 /DNA_ID=CAMNT_0019016037 /DNA_START=63 /DNA_END=224 /DNA_ORIENTATION=-
MHVKSTTRLWKRTARRRAEWTCRSRCRRQADPDRETVAVRLKLCLSHDHPYML